MSLTLAEARARAAVVREVGYELGLDLTDRRSARSQTRIRFAADPGTATFVDLSGALELTASLNGAPLTAYDGRRIAMPTLAGTNELVVDARLPYVTDGNGLHTFTDPADGAVYVAALCAVEPADKVFACFNQPDIKGPVAVTVLADPAWTVLANGVPTSSGSALSERRMFAPTPPLPPYLVTICAGPWASRTWVHQGTTFGWHARRSLEAELDRDFDDLRTTTEQCFDRYQTIFAQPYAFGDYHQVFVPGLAWGAMETPGCVTYRDELLPRGQLPEVVRQRRAMTVAHEMAHMWFGDLVTMRWWEDIWLNESFADYLGVRVATELGVARDARVEFAVRELPRALDADRRRSSHPVAALPDEVPHLDAALGNFDGISYAKGNLALGQLATSLGDEAFLTGVNDYLTRHQFDNASLVDLTAALDRHTEGDVHGWAESWLRTTGADTIAVARHGDVPVLRREGSRPHRLEVAAYDEAWSEIGRTMVELGDDPIRLTGFTGRVVIPNSGGHTYARIRLDEQSAAAIDAGLGAVKDPMLRALLWAHLTDRVRLGDLTLTAYLGLVERHLIAESVPVIVDAVITAATGKLLWVCLAEDEVPAAITQLAAVCATGVGVASDGQLALAFARGYSTCTQSETELRRWLDAGQIRADADLGPTLRWAAIRRLAALGAVDTEFIGAERRADGGIDGELGAAGARAARPNRDDKAEAWYAMTENPRVSNRMAGALAHGLWTVDQSCLVRPFALRYLAEAPELARDRGTGYATILGDAFPTVPFDDELMSALARSLDGDLSTVLRRSWEDAEDDLAAVKRDRRTSR
jgi:aminopeptidase N